MRKLFVAAFAVLSACGPQEATLSGDPGSSAITGSVSPDKTLDEALTVESDLSSTESALNVSPAYVPRCDGVGSWARCHSHIRIDSTGQVFASSTPQGLSPAQLRAAYKLPTTGGAGLTVAIVDSNDDPTAEADLAVYRSQYGLPPCTTANGCFKKVNQRGATSPLPAADEGWAGEIALDLDMVSAVCPQCKILLVEADSASMDNLGAAVNTAASMGAFAISNSYGGSEDSSITQADSQYFNHPGVFITASSGDDGYGASYPATSAHVTAVGGTHLATSTNTRGWAETAWTGAGSGCSKYIAKPSWQHDTGCSKRMMADVSAVADPNSGVAAYASYGNNGGWQVIGGTSAASPIVAATFALTAMQSADSSYSYLHTASFFDVTSGSNGSCGNNTYECKATAGYDGPTGNGTPNAALFGGSGTTGGGSGTTGGGSGSTGGGSGSTGGGSGSTGGGSGSTGGGSGSTGGGTGNTASETESNNSRSSANLLTAGVTMVGSISTSSDVDYFKLVLTPGSTIDVTLTNLNADCDLTLYSSSGSSLAVSNKSGTASEEITGTLSNSIYYVKVKGYGSAKCTNYHLLTTVR